MGLFKFFSKKRAAAIGFQPQKSPQKTSLQTFILEPILTPSGLLDGGDSAPDPVVMDWNMNTLPDVDLPDMDVDADAADAIADVDILDSDGNVTDVIADVDLLDADADTDASDTTTDVELPDADGETDATGTFAASTYEMEISDADIEPVGFFYGDKDDSLTAIAKSSSITSVDIADIDADTDVDPPDIDADTDANASVDLLGSVGDTDATDAIADVEPDTDGDTDAIANVDLPDTDASTDATDTSVDVDLLDTDATGADADPEIPDDGIEAVDFVYNDADNPVTDVIQLSPPFNSGVFTVGETGEVSIDFLFDGGQYQGELAVFSLDGMEGFEPGSEAFIKEAASRALSNSELGHLAIADATEGAKFSGILPHEGNFNTGGYQGVKTFSMRPGDTFGVMLVPHGTVQQLYDNPAAEGYGRPLFSMTTSKPTDLFHMGQIADVTGDGNTFVMEDMRVDGWTDKDYNDVIFQVRGATGKAALLDDVIDSGKDWRSTDMGQALIAYAEPYVTPDPVDDGGAISVDPILDLEGTEDDGEAIAVDTIPDFEDIAENPANDTEVVEEHTHVGEVPVTNMVQPQRFEFAKANQPLVGVIDTGFSANNPDIDYSRIILGQDRVAGDANPLLSAGEGNEHGTHVLGIIGATQDNGVGIDGINDDAPLWVGRAVGSGKWADSLVEFVDAAKESGQPNAIVNLSLDLTQVNPDGSVTTRYEFTPAERAAIEYARQHNVLIVAAAGNDGGVMSVLGQASQEFDNIITVGAAERVNNEFALSKAFDRAAYSSYGNGLDIMADGGTIENPELSTTGDGVGTMAGTSVASAKVTGAVSQVWAANPGLSYRLVIEILKNTAADLKTPGWDGETGAGLLNMAAAVHLAKATQPEEYDAPATLIPETWSGEGRVTASERAAEVWSTNFTGRVMANSANVRSGPGTGYSIVGSRSYNNYVNFDGWTYGERITDIALGTPDERWYRIAGTNQWIASAIVDGNAPGSTPLPPAQPQPQPQPQTTTPDWQKAIDNEWQQTQHLLGNPKSEYDATPSPQGTSGKFRDYEYGTIHWTPQYGAVAVWHDLQREYSEYNSPNGSGGWLGFPTRREYPWNGGMRTDFEGGYIYWNGQRAKAYRSWEMPNGTQPNPQPQPQPQPQPIPQVPINDKSDNYRKGLINPFAYRWIGQCTWYTYGRMLETGLLPAAIKNNALFRGNAGTWKRDAEKVGLPVTSTPTAGARGIVVWPPKVKGAGSVGHVAFLEEVYPDGRIRITEANWPTGSWIKERILTPAQYTGVSFVRLENAQTNSYYAPPATPGQQRQYIVRPGDTLSGIAQRELGNANRWREIQKPGGGTFTEAEARLIQPGQSVYLPVSYQSGTGTPTPVTPRPVQPADFAKALAFVRRWEGGYVNHPSDPGGATNKGITQNTYNAYRAGKGLPARDVRLITDQEVEDIYYTRYWMPSGSNQLTSRLAMVHFDTSVNMGVGGASTLLQQARQSSSGDEMNVVRRYLDLREARYRAIVANNPRMGVFLQGWLNRLNALRREVEVNSVSPPSSTPEVNSNINWVNFSGTVGPSIGVNLRNSPRFSDRRSRNEPNGKRLEFDAWTYGEVGTDMWTGQPDARWFKVKGTNLWVPSAYIYGNPPNSSPLPSGDAAGDDSSSDNSSSDDAIFVGSDPTLPPIAGTTFGKQARVGFVDPYLSLWDSPNKTNRLDYLGFNDILYVAKELPGGWYEVATIDGKVGYVDKNFVITQHPEQGARLHRITSGETAIGIAEQHYKNLIKPGEDLRFFVNALAYANQGMAGIYYEGKQWKDVDWSNIDWTKVKVRADHDIWIPSGEFMQRLRGQVPSGSITGGLWANTVNWVNANVPDWAKFGAAFAGGVLHGATSSVLDIFRGLWDIGKLVLNVIKSLVTGNILSDAKNLWDELSKINWSDLLSALTDDFQKRWNDPDPWKSGHFRGWLLGYLIAEIAVIVLTAGAGVAASGVKVTGKLSKLTEWLSKLPIVGKLIDKTADASKVFKGITIAKNQLPPAKKMSNAGKLLDKGEFTKAGRAFHKHAGANTPDTIKRWGKVEGNDITKNKAGQAHLDEILNSPDTRWTFDYSPTRRQKVIDARHPSGRGARWSEDGSEFIGFVDPKNTNP